MRLSLRLEFVQSDDMTMQYFGTFRNFGIIQQQSTKNIEQKQLIYTDYWKNLVTKKKIYLQSNQEIPNTHRNFYVLMKLGNIIRVQILSPNFSVRDGLKLVTRAKTKNCWSTIDQGYIVHKLQSKFRIQNCI